MKHLIIVLCVALSINTLFAQKISIDKVPTSVLKSFQTKFPTIKKAKWEIEKGNYEAEYDEDKIEHSALFKADGTLIETEIEIAVTQLPKAIVDYVTKNMNGKKIKEASIITETNGKKKYEAEVGGKDYLFDENGNPLN